MSSGHFEQTLRADVETMDDQDGTTRTGEGPSGPALRPPQGAPHGGASQRRVRRDTTEGMIGGVAAGLARHLEVDVVWVRLAFVLTAILASGLGLIAYLAAWIIIPAGDDVDAGAAGGSAQRGGMLGPATGRVPDGVRGARFWVGVGLIGLGSLVLLDRLLGPLQARLGWVSPSQVLVPLALIVGGALLWRSSRSDVALDSATIERNVERFAERAERGAEAAAERLERWVDDGGAIPGLGAAVSPAPPSSPDAAPSPVTPATFGIALVAAGAVWLLSGLGVNGATFARALATALLVIGAGLVVSAFVGRGRGLIGTGLLLTPLVLITTLLVPAHIGMSTMSVEDGVVVIDPDARIEERPTDLAALRDSYTFGVGSVILDLSAVDPAELAAAVTTAITVELGVGDLLVVLPDAATIVVSVELGIGQVDIDGRTSGGLGVSATRTLTGTSEGTGTIVLDIEQGIGRVRVTR
jgi:phage shock protein PspC (stress-responsive transcriptional regulator)